ncbi:MAG: hypothetical protein A4E48_00717 [Methanosaeta sp. PtaU1.Bin060]|nr:MAG: hypothetical protein A4E48_00717 [Methanosaeta sp. PtaU1.Bin060]
MVNMAKQKKKSKGPQHRNSNFQFKNGNDITSSRIDDRHAANKSTPASEAGGAKSLLTGISGSISSAANSITKMLKH